jgi:fatty acid/phospholipid biosynthesis enzyme
MKTENTNNQNEIKDAFYRVYKGKMNFITPILVKYGKRGKLVYEISTGDGFRGGSIYGVTVIELPSKKRSDLNGCFSSLKEAEEYVKNNFLAEINTKHKNKGKKDENATKLDTSQ